MGVIGNLFLQVVLAFSLLIAFLAFIYFLVRRKALSFGRNIKIIERLYLDRSTSILLVRLVDDYFFILVCPSGATVLKKLSDIEVSSLDQERQKSFSEIFFRHVARSGKKDENQ